MKKQLKTLLGISVISASTIVGVFSLTSCANTDPFDSYTVGQAIEITNKKQANFAKTAAEKYIFTFQDTFDWTTIDPTSFPTAQYWMLTDGIDEASRANFVDRALYASAQIYWEFVYFLGKQWSKNNTQSLSIHGSDTTSFVTISADTDSSPSALKISSNYTFVCNGVSSTTLSTFSYVQAASVTDHYKLQLDNTNSSPITFDSYGLSDILFK